MISLCQRAGKLVSGEFSVEKSIRSGQAKLVIIAADASENTKKKFCNKSSYHKIPFIILSAKQELSSACGKTNRSVFAVTDENFAAKLKSFQ